MREILCRGKSIDTGQWAEGFLVVDTIVCEDAVPVKHYHIEKMTLGSFPDDFQSGISETVDPETVGQYTGLTDKNGKKIFEGDILKFSDCGIYPVWWDADFFTFGSCWFSDFDPLYKYDRNKIEVIGNIHDNPELLEGK